AGAGQAAEAEPLFREAYERRRGQPGAGQAEAVEVAGGFGKFLFGLGRYAEAEPLLRAWHEGLEKMPVAGRPAGTWAVQLAEARAQLAALCTATGRPAEAAQWRP
ncbi:MAG: hypothetical protein HY302_13225, partial [Opitutae bacterium]|nr:hypothetical protein [Opitutae bacterium]